MDSIFPQFLLVKSTVVESFKNVLTFWDFLGLNVHWFAHSVVITDFGELSCFSKRNSVRNGKTFFAKGSKHSWSSFLLRTNWIVMYAMKRSGSFSSWPLKCRLRTILLSTSLEGNTSSDRPPLPLSKAKDRNNAKGVGKEVIAAAAAAGASSRTSEKTSSVEYRVGPEGIVFVHADSSPLDDALLLIVSHEVSSTTLIYKINDGDADDDDDDDDSTIEI